VTAPTPRPLATSRSPRATALLLAAELTATGAMWLFLVWRLNAGSAVWLIGHLGLLAICWMVVSGTANPFAGSATASPGSPHSSDHSGVLLVVLAALLLGPLGSAMAGLMILLRAGAPTDSSMLDGWYQRIALAGDVDRITRLATAVSTGRSVNTTGDPPQVFERVIASGSMAERQNALGLIARRFAPAYAPALKAALVSPEPLIRVQAAAVAVKVKSDLAQVLDVFVQHKDQADPLQAAQAAAEISAIIETGLLDAEDAARAADVLDRLTSAAIAGLQSATPDADDPGTVEPSHTTTPPEAFAALPPAARNLIATELLRRDQREAFRAFQAAAASPQRQGA